MAGWGGAPRAVLWEARLVSVMSVPGGASKAGAWKTIKKAAPIMSPSSLLSSQDGPGLSKRILAFPGAMHYLTRPALIT